MTRILCPAIWSVVVMISGVSVAAAGAAPVGKVVFADDFSTPALLAEKWDLHPPGVWKVEEGVLVTAKRGGSRSAVARCTVSGPIHVRVRLKGIEFLKGQWCGVRVRGVHFTLRKDGFWYVYNIVGKTRALGGIITDPKPRPGQWITFDIEVRGERFRWFANGRKLADFREPNPIRQADPPLVLATSGSPIAYDDVEVRALPPAAGNASPNLLTNASFETPGDPVPPGWIPRFIPHIPPEILWRDWGVVTAPDAFHGRRVLRLAGDHAPAGNGFFCANTGVAIGKPVTFSIYLKADAPGRKATLWFWEWLGKWHKKPVTAGATWKRYTFTLDKPEKNMLRGGVRFDGPGVLFADAAQLEEGPAATPWRLSDGDGAADGRQTAARVKIPPPVRLTVMEKPPVLDGRIGKAEWPDAARVWPLVLPQGKTPREKTDAFMAYVDGTLYIAMKCHDTQVSGIRAEPRERDGNLFGDDAVEIFLDTNHDRSTYFHLAVNARGAMWDAGPGRNRSWNGEWRARTFVGRDFWSVEIALPLAILDLSPLTSTRWGVNLCRHQARLEEYSSTAIPDHPDFHVPDRFPVLHWGGDRWFRPYWIVPSGLELRPSGAGSWCVAGRIANFTGRDATVSMTGSVSGCSWQAGPLTLARGAETPFSGTAVRITSRPSGSVPLRAVIRAAGSGSGSESGPILRYVQAAVPVHALFEGMFERSVYTAEPEAIFSGVVRLSPEKREGVRIRIRERGNGGRVLAERAVASGSSRVRIGVPLADLAEGRHRLTSDLLDADGKVLASVPCELCKARADGPVVSIDRVRRCLLVHGRPFLVIAPLMAVWPHTPLNDVDRVIDHFADNGFRSIMFVGRFRGEKAMRVWNRIRSRAEARGLKVLIFAGGFPKTPLEEYTPFIDAWKRSPALLAWMPVDEPELYTTPEPVRKTIDFFKHRDPLHPVYVNNTIMGIPSRFAGLPGDIVSIDDYLTNRPHRKVVEIVRDVEMMRRAADPGGRPVFMFLTCNQLQNHGREPTPEVQTAQTWACILSGAAGVVYFMGDPAGRAHWHAVLRANRELLSLAPVLFSGEEAPAVRCSSPAIVFAPRASGADRYLLAVNVEDAKEDAAFTVPGVQDADAVVLFEDRVLKIRNGVLRDAFAPHARHVYRWQPR